MVGRQWQLELQSRFLFLPGSAGEYQPAIEIRTVLAQRHRKFQCWWWSIFLRVWQ